MDENNEIHVLMIKYLSGETTTREKEKLSLWLTESEENKQVFHDFKEIWDSSGMHDHQNSFNSEKAIERFNARTKRTNAKGAQLHISQLLKVAAIIILILSLPVVLWFYNQSTPTEDNFISVYCEYGDRTIIYLPDSSQVWLNSGSKIKFNNNFHAGARELYLEGEAYFSVRKDPDNPFFVNTSAGLEIKVLGTEFNMKVYPDEESAAVTLVTGSLQVNALDEKILITPNQKLILDKGTGSMNMEELSDLAPETDWINGRLVFRNESLEELKKKLERWFDVEIEFADEEVKTRRFSGTLGKENIMEVVSYFGASQYVDFTINGNKIVFSSEN